VIRVYDAAGNVIETHEHKAISKSGELTISAWPREMAGATSRLDMQRIEQKSGRLESPSALNEVKDQDDDSNYEQEVDQAAANVADEA
jgi:hypothetical protein